MSARIKEGKKAIEKHPSAIHKLLYLISDLWLLYRILYLGLAAVGIAFPGVFCFHTLDLCIRSAQVRDVLRAVTTNGRSILLTVFKTDMYCLFYRLSWHSWLYTVMRWLVSLPSMMLIKKIQHWHAQLCGLV